MTQLINHGEHRVAERPPAIRPPVVKRPWRAWLIGAGVLVVVLAVGFAATSFFIGDGTEVEVYDRGAEHGDMTPLVVYQSPEITTPGFIGQDGNFDPNVAYEHGDFTPMIIYEVPPVTTPGFIGQDANLDPDVEVGVTVDAGAIDPADRKWFDQFAAPADPDLEVDLDTIDPADRKWFDRFAAPADPGLEVDLDTIDPADRKWFDRFAGTSP